VAINTSKVLAGGLAAGVVLNVIDFVTFTYVVADRMKAETEAFKPGLSAAMMQGSAIAAYVITDFVFGILLVWTYAAIRPRLGPGPKTAATVAVLFWIFGSFINANMLLMGMTSMGTWWTIAIIGLVNFLLATWVGAKVYTEDAAA